MNGCFPFACNINVTSGLTMASLVRDSTTKEVAEISAAVSDSGSDVMCTTNADTSRVELAAS